MHPLNNHSNGSLTDPSFSALWTVHLAPRNGLYGSLHSRGSMCSMAPLAIRFYVLYRPSNNGQYGTLHDPSSNALWHPLGMGSMDRHCTPRYPLHGGPEQWLYGQSRNWPLMALWPLPTITQWGLARAAPGGTMAPRQNAQMAGPEIAPDRSNGDVRQA